MHRLISIASRVLFGVAFLLAGVAVWEKVANMMGRTLVFVGRYAPSRLLELAVVALVFVIAMQLRELKSGVGGGRGAA